MKETPEMITSWIHFTENFTEIHQTDNGTGLSNKHSPQSKS